MEAEIEAFISEYSELRYGGDRQRITRNGHLTEQEIQTGIGPVTVQVPRSGDHEPAGDSIVFQSAIVPKYVRKTKSVAALILWLYLKGVSTGAFSDALRALVGNEAVGTTVSSGNHRNH